MIRLHIGCGAVYLDSYINVDIESPKTYLAKDRPDLVERWRTTADRYYAKHEDKTIDVLRHGPLDQEYVCDIYGSFTGLPFAAGSIDEVLSRHTFEHLSQREASRALDAVEQLLKAGGRLVLDVPDHEATLELFKETGDPFYMRHLLGPKRDNHGYHMMSYTRPTLTALLEEHGFRYVQELPNIHFYPAFCLVFEKNVLVPARDWVRIPWQIPDDWLVADIGPGAYPFLRANVYIDRDVNVLRAIGDYRGGKWETIHADVQSGLPQVADRQFDYVFISHTMEHVVDPMKAARTLSRIAKRGTMIVPSVIKESLFLFEEDDHQWSILPSSADGKAVFVRNNRAYIDTFKDIDVQKILCRLMRLGPDKDDWERRYMRHWFFQSDPLLDVVQHWEGELNIRVIE